MLNANHSDRRVILSAARAKYLPGMEAIGRAYAAQYLQAYCDLSEAEITRLFAAAYRMTTKPKEI